jgi:hypothetical protein
MTNAPSSIVDEQLVRAGGATMTAVKKERTIAVLVGLLVGAALGAIAGPLASAFGALIGAWVGFASGWIEREKDGEEPPHTDLRPRI